MLGPLEGENATTITVSTSFALESNNLYTQAVIKEERTASILEEDAGCSGGWVRCQIDGHFIMSARD
jgi:hypothetical protein